MFFNMKGTLMKTTLIILATMAALAIGTTIANADDGSPCNTAKHNCGNGGKGGNGGNGGAGGNSSSTSQSVSVSVSESKAVAKSGSKSSVNARTGDVNVSGGDTNYRAAASSAAVASIPPTATCQVGVSLGVGVIGVNAGAATSFTDEDCTEREEVRLVCSYAVTDYYHSKLASTCLGMINRLKHVRSYNTSLVEAKTSATTTTPTTMAAQETRTGSDDTVVE